MGYIQELEQELTARLAGMDESEQQETIRWVKEKIIESYKNGIMSAKLGRENKEAAQKPRRFSKGYERR
jgi:uncharacterized membrane-anchored protein